MLKIVFINRYPLYSRKIDAYEPGEDAFYLFGMGQFIADEFRKRGYPVKFENWRMDLRLQKTMEKEVNGIYCRIFPAKELRLLSEFSIPMLKALRQARKEKEVVFHFMGVHLLAYHVYAAAVSRRTIIATHLGGPNPFYKFYSMGNRISLSYYLLERYLLLKPYNHFVSISTEEANYFNRVRKPVTRMPIVGVPNVHLLTIRDRAKSRKLLGLPVHKRIILQVGRAMEDRGFDWILDILRSQNYNRDYHFVFAGVHEEDDYYKPLVDQNQHVTGYLTIRELAEYYNAADVLIYLPHGKMDLKFAGTSYVPLEALVCGTPVVATTFVSFPGPDVVEVSRIPKTKEDVMPCVEDILRANINRERCREIALKYFSWDSVLEKYWRLYNAPQ